MVTSFLILFVYYCRYAILLDYIGELEGNKSRITKSYEVRKHLERALEIYPNDPTTWHILGIFIFFIHYYSVFRSLAFCIC